MSPRFGTLSDLPYDIVCRVFSFCTPVTVIRARQCSHALEHVSRDVSLWLGILDRFCLDLGLPRCALLPGYSPLASLYDLERITLGHIALHNRLTAKHSCQTLDAAAVRFIPNSTGSKPEAVKLVSGGRFLVSVASTKIHLWDLGHCALSLSLNPRLVAHHPINIPWEGLQHDQVRIVLSNCSWIGSILQVPIELESDIHNQTAMCTFGLDLGSTNPEFMLVAEIKFESWLVFSPFVDGRVSFFFEGDEHALGVYDFKTGLGVKWYSPQRFNMTDLVASKPELLLAMNSSKMLLSTFKVPLHFAQLRDYKRDSQGFVVIENPTLVTAPWNATLTALGAPKPGVSTGRSQWVDSYDKESSPMCIDFWARLDEQHVFVEHLRISDSLERSVEGPMPFEMVHSAVYPNLPLQKGDFPYCKTFPGGTRVLWWEADDRKSIGIHFSQLELESGHGISGFLDFGEQAGLAGTGQVHWSEYSFEPILGRICLVDGEKLLVLDYLPQ